MKISLILAMTDDRVIGKDNDLPWKLPEDLKRFKRITLGHPVIMGRKTFESLGRPLPGRDNLVVTRNPSYRPKGALAFPTIEGALAWGGSFREKFAIGGADVFRAAYPHAEKIYLTLIHHPFAGNVSFPDLPWRDDFEIASREEKESEGEPKFRYEFLDLVRKRWEGV